VSDACDASDVAYSRKDETSLVKAVKSTLGDVSRAEEDASDALFSFPEPVKVGVMSGALDTVLGTRGARGFRANRLAGPPVPTCTISWQSGHGSMLDGSYLTSPG